MTRLSSSSTRALVGAGFLVFAFVACDEGPTRPFSLPTAPTVAYVPPPPPPFTPPAFTSIEVGDVVRERIDHPPLCVDYAWPCRYFRLTAPRSGKLAVVLTYSSATQGGQGVDLSVRDASGREDTWAEFGNLTETRVTAPVVAGTVYFITMWYTYQDLEYELKVSMQ